MQDVEASSNQNGSSVSSGSKRSRKHLEASDRQLEQDFDDLPDHSKPRQKNTATNGEDAELSTSSSRSKTRSGSSSTRRAESKGRK